jgi:hypothetical protein
LQGFNYSQLQGVVLKLARENINVQAFTPANKGHRAPNTSVGIFQIIFIIFVGYSTHLPIHQQKQLF